MRLMHCDRVRRCQAGRCQWRTRGSAAAPGERRRMKPGRTGRTSARAVLNRYGATAGPLFTLLLAACGARQDGDRRRPPQVPNMHEITIRFAVVDIITSGTMTENSDGTVTFTGEILRMGATGDVVGELVVIINERVDREAGTACNAGIVESGWLTLAATSEHLAHVTGTTRACVSNIDEQARLDSGSLSLRDGCVRLELTGADEVIVDNGNTVSGTWASGNRCGRDGASGSPAAVDLVDLGPLPADACGYAPRLGPTRQRRSSAHVASVLVRCGQTTAQEGARG